MNSASRSAQPSSSTRTPVARGSSVPAWPTSRCPARRRTASTTSCDVRPRGLSSGRIPSTWAILYNRAVPGTLYVLATPIGNLDDLSPRALRVLGEVDAVASEDTRTTLKLLTHFGLRKPVIAYFQHSGERREEQILRRLEDGASIALVSEAGTPA